MWKGGSEEEAMFVEIPGAEMVEMRGCIDSEAWTDRVVLHTITCILVAEWAGLCRELESSRGVESVAQ